MNENIDLTKILKNCPEGWEFYSSVAGSVLFHKLYLGNPDYPVFVYPVSGRGEICFTKKGVYVKDGDAECTLFPSKDQRDWSKFTARWYNKEKFDPKTLQPFDKVLVREEREVWDCELFSYIRENHPCPYVTISSYFKYCIPYNDETKHLVGTTDEAPEFYKYWEE